MELKELSPDAAELRTVIISSSMTSSFMILEEMAAHRELSLHYEDFREHWLALYKSVYKAVSKWKPRKPTR